MCLCKCINVSMCLHVFVWVDMPVHRSQGVGVCMATTLNVHKYLAMSVLLEYVHVWLCTYVQVCVYVFIGVCSYIHMFRYVYKSVYYVQVCVFQVSTYLHLSVCMCVFVCLNIPVCLYPCVSMCTCAWLGVFSLSGSFGMLGLECPAWLPLLSSGSQGRWGLS